MVISVDPDCKLLLYADDSTILFSHRDPDQIASKLSKVLESCSEWLVDSKLSLHLGKTECILFGSKRKLKKIKEFKVKCNDHVIEHTTSVKYLGLNIDNLLSGDLIVKNILSKVNARLNFMYRHSSSLSSRTRKKLMFSPDLVSLCLFVFVLVCRSNQRPKEKVTNCTKKNYQIHQLPGTPNKDNR